MKKQHLILYIYLVLLCSCKNTNLTNTLLNRANDYMSMRPDSALIVLEKLNHSDIKGRYNKAKYALLYSQALDKNYIDIKSDSIISNALKYYRYRGSKQEKAYAYYYSGRIYENKNDIDSAIIQYTHTEELLESIDDKFLLGLTNNALARLYQSQNFIDVAKEKFLVAAQNFIHIEKKANALYSYIGALGMFSVLRQYESFNQYYQIAYNLALEIQDSTQLLYLAKMNASNIIDNTGDYRECINILNSASAKYNKSIMPSDYYFMLGNSYLRLNKPDSAFMYIEPLLSDTRSKISRKQVENLYMASQIYYTKKEYKLAYSYMQQALVSSDSLYFIEKQKTIPELQAKYRNERLSLNNKYLRQINKYQLYIAVIILISVLFILLWLVNRRKKRILQQENEIIEYRQVISRLRDEYEELRLTSQNNKYHADEETINRRITFLKQILETTAQFGHNKEAFYTKIEQLLSKNNGNTQMKKGGSNEILQIFQDILNTRQPGFIEYIKAKYPQLSNQEVSLYCMIAMDISKTAICLVMNTTQKTYYNYRNILRNKLCIANEDMTITQHYIDISQEYSNTQ